MNYNSKFIAKFKPFEIMIKTEDSLAFFGFRAKIVC